MITSNCLLIFFIIPTCFSSVVYDGKTITVIKDEYDNLNNEKIPIENVTLFDKIHTYKNFHDILIPSNRKANENVKSKLQKVINKIVDLAIDGITLALKKQHREFINIQDMKFNFTTGSSFWETDGYFNTSHGTFGDITTAKRTQDVIFSHQGLQFKLFCGFGLREAEMEYKNYSLKYGIINVDGNVSAEIDDVSMIAVVIVDYNQMPCVTKLQELRTDKIGNMTISLTGLGILNSLTSKIVSWVSKTFEEEIFIQIINELTNVITEELNHFDCEKFRFLSFRYNNPITPFFK